MRVGGSKVTCVQVACRNTQLSYSENVKIRDMTTQTSNNNNANPLPFRYQFAAGAVAGISEILVM
jgi:hypothetical protein